MNTLLDGGQKATIRDARRAALTSHPTQIGIDFVTVEPARREVTLHFIDSPDVASKAGALATITRDHVSITGGQGTRPANLRVVSVTPHVARNTVVVTYERDAQGVGATDFPDYVLELVGVPAVDPFFASVGFSLRLNEPAPFDPAPSPSRRAVLPGDPDIDYLARDYASMRRLMLDRMSRQMPRWVERHSADIGVVVVEALAHFADQLSYYQDAVATEAYLGTARRRTSVRRHARLLDYQMHEGCNARVWVQILFDGARVEVPKGTGLLTRGAPEARLAPDAASLADLVADGARWFETVHPAVLLTAHRTLRIYTWGARDYTLPAGAVSATLRDERIDPTDASGARMLDDLRAGQVLIVEEVIGPATGLVADADVRHRHAVRLTSVMRAVDPLGGAVTGDAASPEVPIVHIAWDPADALPFPVVVAATRGDRTTLQNLSVFSGNIVLADHGRTIAGERLPAPSARARYRPALQRVPVTFSAPLGSGLAPSQPAVSLTRQDPRAAVADVTVTESPLGSRSAPVQWLPVRDLLDSDRFAPACVIETEDDGRAVLRFGDGTHGRRPAAESSFTARYRVGNGSDGNVGAEAIAHIVSGDERLTGVRNPLPAVGGTEPEPIEQVRLLAPAAFTVQERCITEADYQVVAERHPEVRQAAASLQWTGSGYTASVAVVRRAGQPVDGAFTRRISAFIAPFRLAGVDVEISAPRYVALDVRLVVSIAPDHFRSTVRQRLSEVFSHTTLPDGRLGFFHPDHFGFGQPMYLSQIVATAMSISGVTQVDIERFQRWGRPARHELASGRIDVGPLEIVRVDNDPRTPDNGLITFRVEGGH